ncbi:1-phosphatidylinositol 4-kinase [Malassezia caprae]|uniref:1-phosphatidylinositol 4-kinase n=1 Tax=Malassezia caprae TaxID=1381934 RepID=A0AAF0E6Z5_9BASI|nr:1-phosphatidylinositol 4-kinase [Malassezia caprae]
MDFLDQPTHTLILNDLAACLARDAAAGVLTETDFAALQYSGAASSEHAFVSVSSVRANLAQARFAAATADAIAASGAPAHDAAYTYLERVAQTLYSAAAQLPHTDLDGSLQGQGQWPLPDELAYTYVETLLKIGACVPDTGLSVLQAVQQLVDGLRHQLQTDASVASTLRCVPQVHGVARAIQDVAFPWDTDALTRLSASLSPLVVDAAVVERLDAMLHLPGQRRATAGDAPPEDAAASPLLEHYARLGTPLSGHFVARCALGAMASLLAQGLRGFVRDEPAYAAAWLAQVRGAPCRPIDASEPVPALVHAYEGAVAALHQGAAPTALYVGETLCTSLKATVLAAAAGAPGAEALALDMVRSALSERAPLHDAALQRAALEGVAVLGRVYPAHVPGLLAHVRRWTALPLQLLEADLAGGAPLLDTAAASMVACMRAASAEPTDLAVSTTYALLNHLSRDPGAGAPASVLVSSTLTVVAALALHLRSPPFTALVVSLLLQRLEGHGRVSPSLVLLHLVALAPEAPRPSFDSVLAALGTAARSALRGDSQVPLGGVAAALLRLARVLDAAAEARAAEVDAAPAGRKAACLPVYLALLIEAGLHAHGRTVEAVRMLLPPVAALVAHDDVEVHRQASPELVYLFRQAWVVLALSGATGGAPAARGDALHVLALKTPMLVPGSVRNYIDDDIDTHSVLKQATLGASPASVRQALGLGEAVRSLSLARLAFVRAVQEVEQRRAACGRVSMALTYLAHPGVAASSLAGPLRDVCVRVLDAFLTHAADRQHAHAADGVLADEVRNVLLALCHARAEVRELAHLYLERLQPVLPSVFAHPDVVVTMLEMAALLGRACDAELDEAYMPTYTYHSSLANMSIDVSDLYAERRERLNEVLARVRRLLSQAQEAMPHTLRGALLRYLHDEASADGLGASLALDYARGRPQPIGASRVRGDAAGPLAHDLLVQGASQGAMGSVSEAECEQVRAALAAALERAPPAPDALAALLYRGGALVVERTPLDLDLVSFLVLVPMHVCTKAALATATHVWTWVLSARPCALVAIVGAVAQGWARTAAARQGLYSTALRADSPLTRPTSMSALDHGAMAAEAQQADELIAGHMLVLQVLEDMLASYGASSAPLMSVLVWLVQHIVDSAPRLNAHPLMRAPRLALASLALRVLSAAHVDVLVEARLRDGVARLLLDWFAHPPTWSFGGDFRRAAQELQLLRSVGAALRAAPLRADSLVATATIAPPARVTLHSAQPLAPRCTLAQALTHLQAELRLLLLLLESEEARLLVWRHPTESCAMPAPRATLADLHTAWLVDARVAVQLCVRFPDAGLRAELGRLVRATPHRVVSCPEALAYLLAAPVEGRAASWLHLWAPEPPVAAIERLTPVGGARDPLVLQYAMRALESYPVELVFFYVPQVVQALRDDALGYVADFVLKTSRISQLFCHQILWNMQANTHKDDLGEVEDALKPTLDRLSGEIVAQLSGEAKAFYEREFGFFQEVTSISGKLKPYIKKSKAEKKAKIDEELAQVHVLEGVYLPSNPDGVVVDLDRHSGRPLQSAAKAPFMATFRVRRPLAAHERQPGAPAHVDVWQSAIFKVGDDCRQDLLALQVMAQFKNIFSAIGLGVYLDPYRVTATSPGCGVIDVVPNATSRDEMGRQKINDLPTFFLQRYGDVRSVPFQRARLHFVQSMAAYSVVCHLLQIRDRHNGNMMVDGAGHLVHIDFGFLFDIGPGGMRFEPYSFKLTHEMVEVMGGPHSPGFALFEQLVVKAFLACRPYADEIVATCRLMLGTELPSFKGPATLQRLHERFKTELSEREAALHAQWLVKDAYGNMRGTLYDLIQEKQNQIPYRR